jgi:hypothetical protein
VRMTKWLISINPPPIGSDSCPDPKAVTQLHGPFAELSELEIRAGEIASDADYPDDLVFAAFEIVDGKPVLLFS